MTAATTLPPPAHHPGVLAPARQVLTVARRNLLHLGSDPQQLVGITVQPLVFLLLFVYVFGGAIAGSSRQYLEFALPGFLVQGAAFTGMQTAVGLNTDLRRGIVDRLRSLPITRLAPVGGRIVADAVRVVAGALIVAGFGVLLGFRSHTPAAHTLAALGLVIGFGVAVCWPMALVGIWLRSPEAVQTTAFLLVLPLTFASSVFAPVASMPGWLQAFVKANPVTAAVDATRGLLLGGPVGDPTRKAVAWIAALTVVFALLATDRYRRRA